MGGDRCWGRLLAATGTVSGRGWASKRKEYGDANENEENDETATNATGNGDALRGEKNADDEWQRDALANERDTEDGQRDTGDLLGRRGTDDDSVWVNRRLLLTAAEQIRKKARLAR